MRIIIIDSYYSNFLADFYQSMPAIASMPYAQQFSKLTNSCFGTADFYSRNLKNFGHEAIEIIENASILQHTWGKEHNLSKSPLTFFMRRKFIPWMGRDNNRALRSIMEKQVSCFSPDVIHFQNPVAFTADQLSLFRAPGRLLTSQIASSFPASADFSCFDLMLSSFPHFVDRFRAQGIHSEYFRLAFDPVVLERLGSQPDTPLGAVFVGGFSRDHTERIIFFEQLAKRIKFDWYGYGTENLDLNSPLRPLYRGTAWGLDMYRILRRSRIAINHHIDVAENSANNMRLYEATGVGTLLLTDQKPNLADQFIPGREIVAYQSVDDCAAMIHHYLAHEPERATIAAAGQARTLAEHTYHHRMRQYLEIIAPLRANRTA